RRPPLPAPAEGAVGAALEAYLATMPARAPEAELHAAALRVLAAKLDAVAASDSVGSAQAAPALAKQFTEALRQLDGGGIDVLAEVQRSLAWLRTGEERW